MSRLHIAAAVLALVLLLAVCALAVLSQDPAEVGPFPTGSGDEVEVAP